MPERYPKGHERAGQFIPKGAAQVPSDDTVADQTRKELSEDDLAKLEKEHVERAPREPNEDAETEENPNGLPAEVHTHRRENVTHAHPIYDDPVHN